MKKNLWCAFTGCILTMLLAIPTFGQPSTKTVVFKKGEVLDILLLSQNPDTEADLKSYFRTAIPVAKRMTYQSVPGFKVATHTQGNLRPGLLILGKWKDLKTRESFLTQIVEEVPDFHERRRKIWSYVGLRYFEMQEDLTFEVDRNKFHVATAYWLDSNGKTSKFYKKWKKQIQKSDGEILLKLNDGNSPFGYRYNPDYFVITSWEDEAAFHDFRKEVQKLKVDNIQHVNEFILE